MKKHTDVIKSLLSLVASMIFMQPQLTVRSALINIQYRLNEPCCIAIAHIHQTSHLNGQTTTVTLITNAHSVCCFGSCSVSCPVIQRRRTVCFPIICEHQIQQQREQGLHSLIIEHVMYSCLKYDSLDGEVFSWIYIGLCHLELLKFLFDQSLKP